MGSTITAATATITTTIQYTVAGITFTIPFTETVASNKDPIIQIIPVTTTNMNILEVDATLDAGNLGSLKKAIFVNKDDTNVITLGFLLAAGDTFYTVLPAGHAFAIGDVRSDVSAAGAAPAALAAFTSWTTVTARADTAACDLLMIAWG